MDKTIFRELQNTFLLNTQSHILLLHILFIFKVAAMQLQKLQKLSHIKIY